MNKSKILRITAFFLVLVLLLCTVGWGVSQSRVEPDNPIETDVDELKVDISKTSGASDSIDDQTDLSEQQENDDNEKESEEEQEESETETETEHETEEESETESETEEESETESESESDEGEKNENLPPETEPGENESGVTDSNSPDEDESGRLPIDEGDQNVDVPGDGDDGGNEHGLVTDLYNRVITFSELKDDVLEFYVYYSDPAVDSNIKVNYRHEDDPGTGDYLSSKNDKDYKADLSLGKNYITVFFTNNDGERTYTRYVITYQADKANENRPEIGENPPIIKTNLDDWNGMINESKFIFVVTAKTWKNEPIYSSNIQVTMDGKVVDAPTGSTSFEYDLTFERPSEGDISNHVITVLAWDNEGNSRYVVYKIQHEYIDAGEKMGTVTVIIDAAVVGCPNVETIVVEVNSGDTAATAVLAALDEAGYEYDYSGIPEQSDTIGFYLRSISRGDAFRGLGLDPRLEMLLKYHGASFTAPGTRDQLREQNFTQDSGWVYCVNGQYPGRALNKWTVGNGVTITLRFTVDKGYDLGGSSYCFSWVGYSVNEYVNNHNFQETERIEPENGADGVIKYACVKCGTEKEESIPWTGESDGESDSDKESSVPGDETDPPGTNPPETDPPGTNPPETDPPETNPPETNPPETNPPETDPMEINTPETAESQADMF